MEGGVHFYIESILYDNRYFTILFLIICPGAPIGSDRYALTFLFESFFEEEGMGHVE